MQVPAAPETLGPSPPLDGEALGLALERALGPERVRRDRGTLVAYSTDASPFHSEPRAVVLVRSEEDLVRTLRVCRDLGVPVTPRAAGTSLSGAAIGPGVVLETSGFRDILEFNAAEGWVRVQPGIPLKDLNRFLATKGFCFPPDPGSDDVCRIGGMIGHNAAGYRTVKYGQTRDYVLALRVVLPDGNLLDARDTPLDGAEWASLAARLPALETVRREVESHRVGILASRRPVKKHSCGYDVFSLADGLARGMFPLATLFVGSEGTLGVVTEAKLKVLPVPSRRLTVLLYLDRFPDLGHLVNEILPLRPSAMEAVDGDSLDMIGREAFGIPATARAMLLVEFDDGDLDARAREIAERIGPRHSLSRPVEVASDPERQAALWKVRKALLPTIYRRPGARKAWGFVEDAIVPQDRVPAFIEYLAALAARYGTQAGIYGHVGDGNTHFRPLFDPTDSGDRERMKAMREEFHRDVLERFGGTPSAEHGIGRLRADILPRIWGPEVYGVMRAIKEALDPRGILNPGVLLASTPWTESWDPVKLPKACVTCGKCNPVCPAYAVLQEEDASARGWFRIANDPSLVLEEARSLLRDCLYCKSCKIVCPAAVDVGHEVNAWRQKHPENVLNELYFEAIHSHPRAFALMTRILGATQFLWDRPAVRRILDFASRPNLLKLPKDMRLPAMSRTTLEERWIELVHRPGRIAYFPGCAANTMADGTGDAILRVLRRNRVDVVIPKWACSGTPMMVYGFADKVRRLARYNVDHLAPFDVVITGCASCNLSLKDYADLLADDPDYAERARSLARKVKDISEFLVELPTFKPPADVGRPTVRVTYHDPCHLRVSDIRRPPREVLRMIPAFDLAEMRDAAVCCGGAGTFSMKNRELSMAHFHQVKGPAVRDSGAAVVASSCPACHIQFRDGLGDGVPVKHVAVLLDEAYRAEDAANGRTPA